MKLTARVISCLNIQDQPHKAAIRSKDKSVTAVMQTSLKPEAEQPLLKEGASSLAEIIDKVPVFEDSFATAVQTKLAKKYKWVKELDPKKAKVNTPKISFFKVEDSSDEFFHIAYCGEFEIRIVGKDGSSSLISDGQTHANMKKQFNVIAKQVSSGCYPSTERFKDLVRSLDESQSLISNTSEGANFLFAHPEVNFKPYFLRIKKDFVSKIMVSSYSLAGLWESYDVSPGPMELLKTPTQDELTSLVFELRKRERLDGFLKQYPRASVNPLHLCLILEPLPG